MWFLLFQSARKIFVIRYFHSSSNVRLQSLAACFNQTQMSGSLFLLPPVPLEANSWLWINPNPPIHSFTHMTHAFLMWGETSLKVPRLGSTTQSTRVVFLNAVCGLFLFLFHLPFYLSSNINMSLPHSLSFSVSSESSLMFCNSFEGITNKITASISLFLSLYLSQGEFPKVLFNWLKNEAFVPFFLLTDHRLYPTCLETRN